MKTKTKPVPGCGACAEREGLYWVRMAISGAEDGLWIAVVTGCAPFLDVRLFDPLETNGHPPVLPTKTQLAALVWLGEIPRPGKGAA